MKRFLAVAVVLSIFSFSGCSMKWKSVREREMEAELEQLKGRLAEGENAKQSLLGQLDKLRAEIGRLQDERAREIKRLTEEKALAAQRAAREKEEEANELLEAQKRLAEELKKELGDARAKLNLTERGLVITFLDEIFFDSGKAMIKPEGAETLAKVAPALKENVPDSPVAVEGHTDNEPIKVSGWRSNWELSTGRALAVVHFLVDQQGLDPKRLRAVGYGEFHPVAPNDTPEAKRQNRRVEIVILPAVLKKVKPGP
ncbi:MAG: OmpA family protein [Candidatus Omnitrophica bacterium]|nr:OmpA family protein [Candidatus Omnitrophota bacterium]